MTFCTVLTKNLKVLKATKQNKLIDGAKILAFRMQFQIDILLIDSICIKCMKFYPENQYYCILLKNMGSSNSEGHR